MRTKVLGLFIIFALVYGLNGTVLHRPIANGQGIVPSAPDRILVKYRKIAEPTAQSFAVASIETAYRLQRVDYFPSSDIHLYRTVLSRDRMIEELKKNPDVQYAEPDFIVHGDQIEPSAIPNDPLLSLQWGMHNTGQTGGTADADIDAPEAWSLTTGSGDVVVGVIDTGVDYNHEDLNANMWRNPGEIPGNGIDDDGNGYIDDYYGINAITDGGDPMDDNRHGTHVAGIIGAVGNNGIGVAGACWTVKIMALKFLDANNSGYVSDAIQCIEYAIQKGAHILNNSWGGADYSQSLKDAIEATKQADILFAVAAGNSGKSLDLYPFYPAAYDCDNILAVAATDHNDELADFSNYGLYSVDVAAPGVSVYSTFPNDTYAYKSGTSMATPHVVGTAALIRSHLGTSSAAQTEGPRNSSIGWRDLKDRILRSAEQKASLQGKLVTGGRINAYAALTVGNITSYVLEVQSSPWPDVLISVSPNDLNGQGNGTTNFSRTYAPYTTVTLSAPAVVGGKNFGYWALDGVKYSTSQTINIKTDFDHTATAVYPLTLSVQSFPDTNIEIQVIPNDDNGQGSGFTNFTRKYASGANVLLTAPTAFNNRGFLRWDKDGSTFSTNPSISFPMTDDTTLKAYYSLTPLTVTVSGAVKGTSDQGISGVTLTFSNGQGTETTDGAGAYTHAVPYGWSGTVTPSKAGLEFSPSTRSYVNLAADQTNQDYAATATSLLNPSLEDGTTAPDYWWTYGNDLTRETGWANGVARTGSRSIKIVNAAGAKARWDGLPISYSAPYPRSLRLGGWAKADNVAAAGVFALEFDIELEDGTLLSYYDALRFSPGTHDWEKAESTVGYAKGIKKISPYCLLYSATGTAWFDDLYADKISITPKTDFNGDGQDDLVWSHSTTGENYLWYMGTSGAGLTGVQAIERRAPFQAGAEVQGMTKIGGAYLPPMTNLNWRIVGAADLTEDGKPDILLRNDVTGENVIWQMNGATRTAEKYLPTVTELNWKIVGTGDFNGDGISDILWRNSLTGENAVWYISGATRSGVGSLATVTELNWKIAGTGDFSGDGKTDILWRNSVTGEMYLWFMDGLTKIGGGAPPAVTTLNWQIAGTGDFNGDGKPDLIWRNYVSGENGFWYMNGATRIGAENILTVTDLNWRIVNR